MRVCKSWQGRSQESDRFVLQEHTSKGHQRAHQWTKFCMKKHLDVCLAGTLFHVCKSGELYPYPTWVIPLKSA